MKRRLLRIGVAVAALAAMLAIPHGATAQVPELVITGDTTLTENYSGHVIIAENGVTLDCAGFQIDATGTGYSGIDIFEKSGVTVKNCTVTGGVFGIAAYFTTGLGVSDNALVANVEDGLRVGWTEGTVVSRNVAEQNGRHGFATGSDVGVEFHGNLSRDNGAAGIAIGAVTMNAVVVGNVATGNATEGFHNHGSVDSYFEGNTAVRNFRGFGFSGFDGVTLVDNVANNNALGGYTIHDARDVTLISNRASRNADLGFVLSQVTGGEMTVNRSQSNRYVGIQIWDSTSITITDNTVINNGARGLHLAFGGDHTVTGNVARNNGGDGIEIESSRNNTVTANTSNQNGDHGFLATDGGSGIPAIDNLFKGNEACRNTLQDAYDESTDSTWIDNDFCTTFNVP